MDVKLWNDSRRRWKRGKGFTHFKQYMDKHMQHIRHFWSYMHGPPQYNKHIKTFNKKHLQLIIFLFSSYLLNSLKQTPPVCHLKSDKTNSQKKSYLQMPRTVCWCSGDAQHTGGGGGGGLTCPSHTSWRPDQTGLWSMRWGFTSLMNWVWCKRDVRDWKSTLMYEWKTVELNLMKRMNNTEMKEDN